MSDHFTTVTHTSWGQKLMNSFVGALIGILLFFGSFFVLWMNEGKIDWSKVASSSVAVDAGSAGTSSDGKFIAAQGVIHSDETLGDAKYLSAGSYLQLNRVVEMYAWKEESRSETKKNLGGGETTTTTYDYVKEWTDSPEDSSSFEYQSNHTNPKKAVDNAAMTVKQAKVGQLSLDTAQLEMPEASNLPLTSDMVEEGSSHRFIEPYIFIGKGTPDAPQIGDLRISYTAVDNDVKATVFGTQQGMAVAPYSYKGESFYRAIAGDRTQAIAVLKTEHDILTWVLRLAGFLMMWFGIMLAFGPITSFLDVLPLLGNIGGFMIGVVSFGIAFVLSAITIIIAIIVHNIILQIILLLLVLGGLVAWVKIRNRNVVAAQA
ncbi:hypothetical protein F8S13_18050 [Chloroflexia bacterium SDU3-3]|nr:hypothetical protein F8S13_18050 [Chloroflexia bacterium SDU3-3]